MNGDAEKEQVRDMNLALERSEQAVHGEDQVSG